MTNRSLRWTGLAIAAVVALIGVSYSVGVHRGATVTHLATGYAYASSQQISAYADGWSYDVPLDIKWMDASGVVRDGSRPACLPASLHRMPVKFAWVPTHMATTRWRAVVWVDCR